MAIKSFGDPHTKLFFETGKIKKLIGWRHVKKIALRKLDLLDYATSLEDLKSPPGNRLESLKSNLKGYYSIRINDQWRIIFRWMKDGPEDVSIIDYHK